MFVEVNIKDQFGQFLQTHVVYVFPWLQFGFQNVFDFGYSLQEGESSSCVKEVYRRDAEVGDEILDVWIAAVEDFGNFGVAEEGWEASGRAWSEGISYVEAVDDKVTIQGG